PGRHPRPPGVGRRRRALPGRRAVLAGPGHRRVGPAPRDGGQPMTLRRPDEDAVLACEEIAMVRQVLVSCSHLLAWAGAPAARAARAAAGETPAAGGRGRTAGGLYYDVNLAIDSLDSAAPAGSSR